MTQFFFFPSITGCRKENCSIPPSPQLVLMLECLPQHYCILPAGGSGSLHDWQNTRTTASGCSRWQESYVEKSNRPVVPKSIDGSPLNRPNFSPCMGHLTGCLIIQVLLVKFCILIAIEGISPQEKGAWAIHIHKREHFQ